MAFARAIAFAIASILVCLAQASSPLVERDTDTTDPVWGQFQPSRHLKYYDCYKKFKCARLIVPLDWNATEATLYDKVATIAIIKYPATVPMSDPNYGGTVVINPGGPGGSGVQTVQFGARLYRKWIDSKKHFDIVGFDPRGIYQTTPGASCFRNGKLRSQFNALDHDEGNVDEGERVVDVKYARAQAVGDQCSHKEFGKYVSSADVARDMVEIADKLEEFRQEEMRKADPNSLLLERDTLDTTKQPVKLNYLGFSYGTMLGNTFASLYPDRVGKFVLDGVVDAPDYIAQGWKKNLLDTEKVLKRSYKYCFKAGPSRCHIYNANGPEAIAQDVEALLQKLKSDPVGVGVDDTRGKPFIVTYALVKYYLFESLYDPVEAFVPFSSVLAQMMKGNYIPFSSYVADLLDTRCPKGAFKKSPINEATTAIICSDGDPKNMETKAQFNQYVKLLESQSPTGGAIWAQIIRLQCTGWKVRPRWRFTGPFTGRTATPILWMGNTADPVTPLINTINMAKMHPGSGTLTQDSEGHTALFSNPSNCTINIVQQYFNSAKLPRQGTRCPASHHAFQKRPKSAVSFNDDDEGSDPLEMPRWPRPHRFVLGLD